MQFNIQSFGDIITNSSTEVFPCCDETGLNGIKNLITEMIKMFEPDKDFDDYFEIRQEYSDEFEECIENDHEFVEDCFNEFCEKGNLSNDAILAKSPKFLEYLHDCWLSDERNYNSNGYKYVCVAKDQKFQNLANNIADIPYIFNYDYRYC